ncbi:MAG: MurR/RpiR family transcriptional regulator, partial [Traorella sp.]
LGYSSFREMLADLSATASCDIIEEELNTEESDEKTLQKIILQIQDITALTLESNSNHEIEQAVELLKKASQIIFFGVESSNLYAKYLANQLTKMGFLCLTSDSPDTAYLQILHAPKNSVLFLVSESGRTNEVLKAAQLAKTKENLSIVAMTRRIKNPLHEYADIILKTVTFDTLTRFNISTMRASQLYLIDAIYLLIMKSDFDHYNHMIEQSEIVTGRIEHKKKV